MSKPDLDIIRSPEAEKMRRMVTEGFYDRSRLALWIFEIIGREYDDMAQWARAIRFEAFPQTCTWSIAIWEWIYGIDPDETLPLEYRRQRLLTHKLTRAPINPANIEAMLSSLTDCPVHVTEHIAPYTFGVDIDVSGGKPIKCSQALDLLRKVKPSHLSVRTTFISETPIHVPLTVTGATFPGIMRTTLPAYIPTHTQTSHVRVGAVQGAATRTKLYQYEGGG